MEAPKSTQSKAELNGKTILVVEDDAVVRTLLIKLLEKYGATVLSAVDGLAALAWLQDHSPDLILADIMMPRLDGFTLVRTLRFLKDKHGWPTHIVIFLTAKTDARSMIDGTNLGARYYITKPFQIENVIAKITKALRDGKRK